MVSGGTNDSTSAPAAGVPDIQSKTLPASLVRGIVITVYEVLERHPCVGLTPISPRCHDASGTPSRGEIRKRSLRVVTEGGRSATVSSKRKINSFGLTPTLPESGIVATSWGGATSTGPPGGMPGEAHPDTSRATATSRRKALSPFPPAARAV